jgi:uncharacterized HAD superfamily protein
MTTRRLYVDLDDVLAETTSRFPAVVERLFGRTTTFEEIDTFHLDVAFGLDEEQTQRLVDHVHEGDWLLEIEPRPGAVEVLRRWQAAGHEIRVVTGRPPRSHEPSVEWLVRHGVPHAHFHLCDKYGRFEANGSVLSLDEVRALDFDLAVEDSAEMAGLLAGWGVETVLLLDRPWNRARELPAGVRRVADWAEIAALGAV